MASTESKLRTLGRTSGARSVLMRSAQALGFDLVKRNFYSPLPDWRAMPESTWTTPTPMAGIRFDVPAQLAYVQERLAPFMPEFTPPQARPDGELAYHYANGFFQGVDADILYATVRELKPSCIIELGSGYSSLVMAQAAARNAQDGRPCRHDVYDPFSRDDLAPVIRKVADLHLVSATDVPLEAFAALEAGDVLFVDTTHTVKLKSDVNYIVLDVLPVLQPGVVVHFHDIFLPYEYPKEWFTWPEVYWAEQYLLQAFLQFNDAFEVLLGVAAVLHDHEAELAGAGCATTLTKTPGSFWLRRVT